MLTSVAMGSGRSAQLDTLHLSTSILPRCILCRAVLDEMKPPVRPSERLSVCLSVKCVICDKTKETSAQILYHTKERLSWFLSFTFAICHRPAVCLALVCLSSVTLVHPTQAIEIFGNVSTPCGTLAILHEFDLATT